MPKWMVETVTVIGDLTVMLAAGAQRKVINDASGNRQTKATTTQEAQRASIPPPLKVSSHLSAYMGEPHPHYAMSAEPTEHPMESDRAKEKEEKVTEPTGKMV